MAQKEHIGFKGICTLSAGYMLTPPSGILPQEFVLGSSIFIL